MYDFLQIKMFYLNFNQIICFRENGTFLIENSFRQIDLPSLVQKKTTRHVFYLMSVLGEFPKYQKPITEDIALVFNIQKVF